MLKDLTREQDALCDAVAEEYLKLLTHPEPISVAAVKPWLRVVYGLYDKKTPTRIEIVPSPYAALDLASSLTGEKETALDCVGLADGGWVSFYDYFQRIDVLTADEAADVLALKRFYACAWDMVLLDGCAIVVRRPTVLRLDDQGALHAADGPCIEWADGAKDFAWHGTWVPERVITDPRGHTRKEYDAITNTEVRRALAEHAGWDWLVDLLGATQRDAWTDPATGLAYVLLRSEDGQKFLRKQSPPLKAGDAQPTYIEPVHEDLKTARAARKWQATTSTPAECEADPDLKYGIET